MFENDKLTKCFKANVVLTDHFNEIWEHCLLIRITKLVTSSIGTDLFAPRSLTAK